MIVRWGLDELDGLLAELAIERPFVVASERWAELPLPGVGRWTEVPTDRIAEVTAAAGDADGLLAVGGGSAIDLGKAVSAESGLPLVSVPTTYSGSEWTGFFGVRDPGRRMKGGGAGAHLAGIVYEPRLTLDLPRDQSGGTALNALAHCAEALYVAGHNPEGDREALAGAKLIGAALPQVLADGQDLEARTRLLEGAQHAGAALGSAGLALGHAMAQALGGRYGIAHGAANALSLPPALRFNEPVAAEAIGRFGEALGVADPAARVEELARASGFTRLRELGVPEDELDEVAAAVVAARRREGEPAPGEPGRGRGASCARSGDASALQARGASAYDCRHAAERGGVRAAGDARAGTGGSGGLPRRPRPRRWADARQRDEGPRGGPGRARRPRRHPGAEGNRARLRTGRSSSARWSPTPS